MDINANHPLAKLSNAIVLQAVEDYTNALVEQHEAEEMLYNAEKMIADCTSFFRGDWVCALTDVPADRLIEFARTKAQYLIWQKENGCGAKCKFTACPYRVRGYGWNEWGNSDKRCLRRDFHYANRVDRRKAAP